MREIKFRAWDSRNRVMGDGINVLDDEFDGMVTHFQDAQYVCMQYTGLKDRYGHQMYEGDIIHEYENDVSLKKLYRVVWNDVGVLGWYAEDFKKNIEGCYLHSGDSQWEVIGNIYKNPELLK